MAYTEVSRCVVSGVEVRKLRSTRTGVTVCLAQVEGPLVNGYFCLGDLLFYSDALLIVSCQLLLYRTAYLNRGRM